MNDDMKFFLWFEQTEDKIVPYNTSRGRGVKKTLDSLPEEEARKLKRKYRKIMRQLCKAETKDQEGYHDSHYGFHVKQKIFLQYKAYYMSRRRSTVLLSYVEFVKQKYFPRDENHYCKYRGKKKKK